MIMENSVFAIISFSTGFAISSAIFAFLSIIGLIPRLISKSKTEKHIMFYENVIIIAGGIGAILYCFDISFNIGVILYFYLIFSLGIFVGSLAVCVTEVIDILPIIVRFFKFKNKMRLLLISLALGKGVGAFVFYFYGLYDKVVK
ncbi:MAG: stage V sporulation protein AB [Lachnospirales bacterium]